MLGQKYLYESHAVLTDKSRPAGVRLAEGGRLFWRAMVLHDAWPEHLKGRTADALRRLIELGVVGRPVPALQEADADAACDEILRLIEEFRAAARAPQKGSRDSVTG